ncbi:MAG: CoA pyrophosphatase [Anaerolineae bacterium]
MSADYTTGTMITLDMLTRAVRLPNFDLDSAWHGLMPVRRPEPPPGVLPRQAGVLVLTYPETDGLHVVLTRRTETLKSHSGQISFPGGRRGPEDDSFTATALRETCEELGICEPVEIIGMLSTLYIPPSNFQVHPIVATVPVRPTYIPNPDEVAEVFTMPLYYLLDAEVKETEEREFNGKPLPVTYYRVNGHKVWGATAFMLSELEHRLRQVLG